MEELLNKLIEKGWKPRWLKHKIFSVQRTPDNMIYFDWWFGLERCYDFRQLTSKESLLRQFCVENKLVNKYADISDEEEAYIWKWKSWLDAVDINWDYIRLDDDYDEYHQDTDYKYWLIQSSLIDEDRLEQFLLDNIKIEWNLIPNEKQEKI